MPPRDYLEAGAAASLRSFTAWLSTIIEPTRFVV